MKRFLQHVLLRLGYSIKRVHPEFIDRDYTRGFGEDWRDDLSRILDVQNINLVLDVGANVGQSALEFAAIFPTAEIHSFEPDPEIFSILNERTSSISRIFTYNLGLGNKGETRTFYKHEDSVFSSFIEHLDGLVWATNVAELPSIKIERLDELEGIKGSRIDFLKIDTQGFDLEVLHGASRLFQKKNVRSALIELNMEAYYKSSFSFFDVFEFMNKAGFVVVGLYDLHSNPKRKRFGWCNVLFALNEVVQDACSH